jgi:hypothetical protein
MFAYAVFAALRVRRRALNADIPPADRQFFVTSANALVTSMVAFLIGGAFVALAFNEMTWMTFALAASLDRLSAELCARSVPVAVTSAPLAPAMLTPAHAMSRVPHEGVS